MLICMYHHIWLKTSLKWIYKALNVLGIEKPYKAKRTGYNPDTWVNLHSKYIGLLLHINMLENHPVNSGDFSNMRMRCLHQSWASYYEPYMRLRSGVNV